jgi:hypothetical protein
MENVLAGLNPNICCVFIDDVIIFGKTYEEQLHNLQLVFDRIKAANLKQSPKKCEFFKRKVKFVGHIVSEKGIEIILTGQLRRQFVLCDPQRFRLDGNQISCQSRRRSGFLINSQVILQCVEVHSCLSSSSYIPT